MTQVSIITTLQHNVGDDFVREGIIHLLSRVLGPLKLGLIHKHLPITVRPEFAWIHSTGLDHQLARVRPLLALRSTQLLDSLLPVLPWTDKIRRCDLLVQSGAPVYWINQKNDCSHNEWWQSLIERRWAPHAKGRPFLNLAGGTCQPYHSDASEFAGRPDTLNYIRRFHDLCRLTTVRDQLSLEVLRHADRAAELLPCTSIFAVDQLGIKPEPGGYVALNYMPGGGHYDFGQPIDGAAWERRFKALVAHLTPRHPCVLVCHDQKELGAARRLWPELPQFWSPRHRDYLEFYSKARFGIFNRVHAAFALASLGKPAAVIGSDSRARMAPVIGLESVYVDDASEDWLIAQSQRLEQRIKQFPEEMMDRKRKAESRYLELLEKACRSGA